MNRTLSFRRLLPATLLLVTAACSSDDDTKIQFPTGITLSAQEFTFEPGGREALRITFTPANAAVQPGDLALVDAETGAVAQYVAMQYNGRSDDGGFDMLVRDNRTATKYSERLKVVCAKTDAASAILTVQSKPYMPIVRLTSERPVQDKENWIGGTISIDGGNSFEDLDLTDVQVRGRGNTTWGWEKKPYALKFGSKTPVLGMPKHKRWCLIANYMDRTQLRNRIAYHIGRHSNLKWTVRNEYAELYLNDAYQGCYLLTEQIKVDSKRLDITEMEPADNEGEALTGGYLLELDDYFDEEKKFRSDATELPVNIKFPDPEDLTERQFAYIQDYFNAADNAVKNRRAEMFDYFDRASLIDYWIITEVTANHEPRNPKSTYFYKDRGGRLTAGPIWDFDYETLVEHTRKEWMLYDKPNMMICTWQPSWWPIFFENADFRAAAKARWQEWYPFLKSVPDFIEQERKAISSAVVRDNRRWPAINGTGNPNRDENLSFDGAVNRLKTVYKTRLEWMNAEISKW